MIGRQDRYTGNILLYGYLSSKRAPVFLNRNLTRAFEVHRQLLQGNSVTKLRDKFDLRMIWEPPCRDSLDEMVELSNFNGSFFLDIHGIKSFDENRPARHEAEPTRKARLLLRSQGTVQATVFSPSSDLPCLSIPAQDATLTSSAKSARKAVSVETESIRIRLENLGSNPRSITTSDAYTISISINLETQNAAEDLYGYLGGREVSTQDLSTRLSTSWRNILVCPTGRTTLPLRDWKGQLAFGLEVTMYWASTGGETILTTHNRRLRATQQPLTYPTPPLDQDSRQTVLVIFAYSRERITRTELVCPHEGCQRRKYADINELRMHLDAWHDYFNYQATHRGRDRDGVDVWLFECEVADHKAEQRASARADEPYDIRNLAPQQPFDQVRYLNDGNDDFQKMSRLEKKHATSRNAVAAAPRIPTIPKRKPPEHVQDMPARERRRYVVPQAPGGVTFVRGCSRRPLRTGESISESDDEVDDRWIKSRRAAEYDKESEVPEPAKQLLKALDDHMWEEQLRSDVHLGDAILRFTKAHAIWLRQEDVFDAYRNKLDEVMSDDIISREVYLACLKLIEMQNPVFADNADELSQQLAELDVEFESHINRPEDSLTRGATAQNRAFRGSNKGKGKAKITETGNLTPVTAGSDGDAEMLETSPSINTRPHIGQEELPNEHTPYDLCLCGKDALASRTKFSWLACNNMDCIRRNYHVACIKDRWHIDQDPRILRRQHWTCNICKQ
ncbi:hypothetical protein FB567DRAFT_308560 [Paraphoma chrysanthemicola]|uniref:Polycomb protein VEFS-Box domain-containing protein n=1 Tax=Paraphoma chrysanthemicola TaxID=798071 RepID=A0A8K0W0V4_9PLEO|nr:hypothetical protein FB567DRAFT_308560 [Paraphoma chrysanthemicola]